MGSGSLVVMRSIRLAAAFAIFAVFVSACGAGPSSRPVVAVVQGFK